MTDLVSGMAKALLLNSTPTGRSERWSSSSEIVADCISAASSSLGLTSILVRTSLSAEDGWLPKWKFEAEIAKGFLVSSDLLKHLCEVERLELIYIDASVVELRRVMAANVTHLYRGPLIWLEFAVEKLQASSQSVYFARRGTKLGWAQQLCELAMILFVVPVFWAWPMSSSISINSPLWALGSYRVNIDHPVCPHWASLRLIGQLWATHNCPWVWWKPQQQFSGPKVPGFIL